MNIRSAAVLVPCLVSFVTGASALAQENQSQGFVLEAGDHDISDVIGQAAQFMGRNLIVQQQELAGNRDNQITLQKSLNLDLLGCEEVVSQLAWLKGLVMSPVDPGRGIYEFINVRGPRRAEIRSTYKTPSEIIKRPQLKILVSTSMHLKHIDAMRASQYLRPLMQSNGRSSINLQIGSLGTRHALMLQGLTDQVANAINMVSIMDTPEAKQESPDVGQRIAVLETEKAKLLRDLDALRKRILAIEQRGKSGRK